MESRIYISPDMLEKIVRNIPPLKFSVAAGMLSGEAEIAGLKVGEDIAIIPVKMDSGALPDFTVEIAGFSVSDGKLLCRVSRLGVAKGAVLDMAGRAMKYIIEGIAARMTEGRLSARVRGDELEIGLDEFLAGYLPQLPEIKVLSVKVSRGVELLLR